MKGWYVMLIRRPSGCVVARVEYVGRRNMYLRYRAGRIIEYRACGCFLEGMVLALIYNYKWAAWIYHNRWGGGV